MRSRNLKPGFFKNADLADAGPHTQLLFAGLWLMADKEGRLKDQPRVIKAELFPYYDVDVNRELTVLSRLGHVHRFVANEIGVIEVRNFKKHQSPHHTEKPSELPGADDVSPCIQGTREINGDATVNSPLENGGNPSDSQIPDSQIQCKTGRIDRSFQIQVVAAYHEILSTQPRVKAWTKKREGLLAARIKERCSGGKPADTIEYWRDLFAKVAQSDFLCGRTKASFSATLEWIVRPENFLKIIEGNYDNRGRGNGVARG